MIITVNSEKKEVKDGMTLSQVVVDFTPYGEEATVLVHNGNYYKSIDEAILHIIVEDGDDISIAPLIIGG